MKEIKTYLLVSASHYLVVQYVTELFPAPSSPASPAGTDSDPGPTPTLADAPSVASPAASSYGAAASSATATAASGTPSVASTAASSAAPPDEQDAYHTAAGADKPSTNASFERIDPVRLAAQILGAMSVCRETGDLFVQVTLARYLRVSE